MFQQYMQQPGPPVVQAGETKSITASDGEEIRVIPLGSGGEVGRSCVITSYKGKNVMFDCGTHPAKQKLDALPYFDAFQMETVDILLITHFHLDHCAALPYLLTQTKFNGKVYMTSATKAFYKYVMADFCKIGSAVNDVVQPEWIQATIERIETIEYHEEKSWAGIKFQPFNAGHVLGAAMFLVEIAGVKVLYTGDFSSVDDRHLMGAEVPPVSPDVLIVESTYGIQVHETREEREEKFIKSVEEIVRRGGRCLIPVFALGRAQELLLILEEHWQQNKELQGIKIYYASSLAERCMKLYQTYVHSMNDRVRRQQEFTSTNPFQFNFIKPLRSLRDFDDSGPSVVIAAPGMLQNGLSLELFTRWCGDQKNGIIFAGYCVQGSLASIVQGKPKEVTLDSGTVLKVRMSTIETVSFSAHSDARQTGEFIAKLPDVSSVVLVHGNADAMDKLRKKLAEDFKNTRAMTVHTTKSPEPVILSHSTQRTVKVLGSLANATGAGALTTGGNAVADGQRVSGILLVSQEGDHLIVHPNDVATFTGLTHATLTQAMILPLPVFRSGLDILTVLRRYFAGSQSYNSLEAASIRTKGGLEAAAAPSGAEGDSEVLLVGHGLADLSVDAADNNYQQVPDAAPRGVLVKLRTDAASAHTIVTIEWRASRLTDLVADVVCLALSRIPETSDLSKQRTGGGVGGVDAGSHVVPNGGDVNPVPVGISDSVDRTFKLKCFHQMLSQFFPSIQSNLVTGDCLLTATNGEKLLVRNCIEVVSADESVAGHTAPDGSVINGVTKANYDNVMIVLKRLYLTLFPIPADFGWCECGEQHGEDHLVYQAEAQGGM